MAPAGLFESFLAAIQASLSALLVMAYGALAAHLKLIDRATTKPISKICVRMFLPALLITKVGSELHADSAHRYVVILVWGIVCHVISFLLGILGHRTMGMPDWVTVAILINNTTSYPLLLISALEDTGILTPLIVTDETPKDAIERAKSYFLVFSTISNCITFAVGPRLIDSEHAAEDEGDDKTGDAHGSDAHDDGPSSPDVEANEETRLLGPRRPGPPPPASPSPFRRNSFFLSQPSARRRKPELQPDRRKPWFVTHARWDRLSQRAKWWLLFAVDFCNAPLLGALAGVVLGLVPALHRAFFDSTAEGGIFTAWLTASLKTIGGLFVPLPVVVAGVTLFCSSREAKENNQGFMGMPWGTVVYILAVRFVAWPVLSISAVYLLATRTALLGSDPVLWFCLAMMPAGPSAMKLITLVQVANGTKDDELCISRLLTISYIISPVLSLTVAGSLLASQAAIPK